MAVILLPVVFDCSTALRSQAITSWHILGGYQFLVPYSRNVKEHGTIPFAAFELNQS